jgi:hypothetical protein
MGGQANTQQPVFYDADMGQYYTQSTPAQSLGAFMQNPMQNPTNNLNILGSFFGKGGERNYLNNFGQSSPAMQPQAPYEYANTSIAELFPMLQGQAMNQGGGDSALAGLLSGSAPSATGSASSGAGRFL